MTMVSSTGRAEQRACSRCGAAVEHRESATASCGHEKTFWMAERHEAACGLPCIGGGVKPAQIRGEGVHGYQDRCPMCGPLRVLPEVVAEMRGRAYGLGGLLDAASPLEDTNHSQTCSCADCQRIWQHAGNLSLNRRIAVDAASIVRLDLLRALDEIDKLRAELASAIHALSEARGQATFTRLELQPREIATEEQRVALAVAPSPLTDEQREALGIEAFAEARAFLGEEGWDPAAWSGLIEKRRGFYRRIGERLFLRGLGAGSDLLEAGQLLKRILDNDDLPKADREIPPGLTIAVDRITGAVERLGARPPDREPPRSSEPATEDEREEAYGE